MSFAAPPLKNQVVLILVLTTLLIGLIVTQSRCGQGVEVMFKTLEGPNLHRDGGTGNGATPR